MKLTPRDKAILVGLHMSGGSSEGLPHLLTLDQHLTREWFETFLKELHRRVPTNELETFEAKLDTVFYDGYNPRYPIEYVDKLSPLAIATWLATNSQKYAQVAWSEYDRNLFLAAFFKKWSINLTVDLEPCMEDDEINLWLLTQRYLREFAPQLTPLLTAKYHRRGKTIYLSGGQQFAKDGGANWRSLVSPALYRAGYDIFNPVFEGQAVLDTYGVNFDQLTLEEYIGAGGMFIEKDLEAIKSSDAVLTLLDESAMRGAGTKSEATISVDYNIPNFFVLADNFEARKLPIWLAGCIRNKKFLFEHNDFNGAIRAIKRIV